MMNSLKSVTVALLIMGGCYVSVAQRAEKVKFVKEGESKVNIFVGDKLFTTFLYPDTLEKPVLYPIRAANGTTVTRGFPITPQPGDPTDHPHHLGLWFNFENVNKLDFWNNSFNIPAEKKSSYGWIRTDKLLNTTDGAKGTLSYHANWTNQQKEVLLEETTRLEFSGTEHQRIIDRITTLTAKTDVRFTDAKDGMLGLRVAHELQIPEIKDQKFTDDKGNVTTVKGKADSIASGNYMTSEGKMGNDAWSTRGNWCKMYGKMKNDSISIVIIDHPGNINYPTYWHARGYGLFAANPLGAKAFTNGREESNLALKPGESVTFRYRIVVDNNSKTISVPQIEKLVKDFAAVK
jgi:Methane oxygenase PmoA